MNEGGNVTRRKTKEHPDSKRPQRGSPSKRGRAFKHQTAFRKQCVQDPDDPISDVESSGRPNKHMRSTPERAERCQKVSSPIGGLARTRTGTVPPDTKCDRKDVKYQG